MSKASRLASRSHKNVEELVEARSGENASPGLTLVAENVGVLEADNVPELAVQAKEPKLVIEQVQNTGGKWDRFSLPLKRGSEYRHRVSIQINEETAQRLRDLDVALTSEGKHPISRNALLTEAAICIGENPDRYEAPGDSSRNVDLQGRVPDRQHEMIQAVRFTQSGRRSISAMMAAAVLELLSD
jgi:hypothetical protein